MRNTMTITAAAAAALAAAGCATMTTGGTSGPRTLDRAELIGVAETYLASLAAHDPTAAPLADEVVIVENIEQIEPGDGLWDATTAAPTTFKILVPDEIAQAVGILATMQVDGPLPPPAEGEPAGSGPSTRVVAIRLQLEDGAIVEAEHLVTNAITGQGQFGAGQLENLQTPRPGLLAEVPEAERMRRDQLVWIADTYYDALEGDRGALSPFADDCERRENGIRTAYPGDVTGMDGNSPGYFSAVGCSKQLDTGVMSYIDSLDNRRVFAADPVTGLAMGLTQFRHSMVNRTLEIRGVPGVTERAVNFEPFDLPAAHVYKIRDGKIHEIEAMGFRADYMSPTGWE
jgi:hypothetical protein